jgi:alpha-mannosidase
LFEKYPAYTFSFEGSFRYKLAREYYPEWYATMTNYVKKGRWHVTGSVFDAGDVNVPSPESLFRHILHGNGFWKKELGVSSVDIFLPDCFGFGYALPSIAAHSGLKGFSTQKLTWGSAIPVPFQNIGKWVGVDGQSLVAALQPGSYTSQIEGNLANDLGYLNRITNMGSATGLYIDYRYFGTGDTGGSPDEPSVNWLQQSVSAKDGLLTVISAPADQIFRDLTPEHIRRLPTYEGELLLTTHSTGCYTSQPEMKKYNRQNELRADSAERLAVIADWLQGGASYPQDRFNRSWERFLWHQFHDDLTGTSIPEAYKFSWNDELIALNEFGAEMAHSASMLSKAMDTTAEGIPLLVCNPLAISRQDVVEANVLFTNGVPAAIRVFDAGGNEVPSQMGTLVGNVLPITFLASVPPNGAAVFDVRPAESPSALNTGLSVSVSHLENPNYRVQIDANGDVSSVFDKRLNRQLLSAPIRWAFLPVVSTTWPAWEIPYNAVTATPYAYLGGTPIIRISESGPARAALEITRTTAGSTLTERLRLAGVAGGDRLEWDVSASWGSRQTLLKTVFPLTSTNSLATYDLGLGTIQRKTSTESLYEVPAQQWADLTSSNAAFGITVMSDSKYGWDKPDNRTLRLTAFHTPGVGSSYVYQATNGFGSHRFSFGLMGHAGDWRTGKSPWVAARMNQPLQAFQTQPHPGMLGKSFAFLSCDNSNVMVKAVKKAENTSEIVVRLQELSGQPQTAKISFAAPISTVRKLNGAEEHLASLASADGTVDIALTPYQPMTLAFTLQSPARFILRPTSAPVSLPFNVDVVTRDANRADGAFEGDYSYPAELMPSTLKLGGISFQTGPTQDGALNAVACQGQTIPLPSGYNRLFLLAAAASNDVTAAFLVDGQPSVLAIQHFTGFIGQWNPPWLKPAEVGWVSTHRHTLKGNDAYRFCYLFKYQLDLPPGASTLTLPVSPNVRLFAASVAANLADDARAAGGALAQNEFPWADAGADRRVSADGSLAATVTLDASNSADRDGQIVSYRWTTNGALAGTGVRPAVVLPIGTNQILLAVTDNQGQSSYDSLSIVVLPRLEVSSSATPTNSGSAPLTVQFTCQASGGKATPSDTTDDLTGTVSAQGQNSGSGETAASAFDNSSSSKWLDFANANPNTRASWIQYRYADDIRQVVTSYTITSANDAPSRDPANWQMLGSNDDGSTWSVLDQRTGETFSSRSQKRSFSVSNSQAFNIYRLQIDSVANPSSANSVQLAEIELLGTPAYTYLWAFGDGSSSTQQNPQHTYSSTGSFLATVSASYGFQTGTNTILISIGSPLEAVCSAAPTNTAPFGVVQFQAQASGGNLNRPLSDTTDNGYGWIMAQGENAPNEIALNAFDNTTSSKWLDFATLDPSTRSSWIQYRYANDARYVVSRYTISSANDATVYPNRNPTSWRLLAANGEDAWITLDVRTNQVFTANYQTLSYTFANTNAYNVYRLQIDSISNALSANCLQLSELEFIGRAAPSYRWAFGDGETSNAQNPTHQYAAPGTYEVTVQVLDGTASAVRTVNVYVLTPNLSAVPLADRSLEMTWPDWASGYALYYSTDLSLDVWLKVTNNVSESSGQMRVVLPMNSEKRFFQLRPIIPN